MRTLMRSLLLIAFSVWLRATCWRQCRCAKYSHFTHMLATLGDTRRQTMHISRLRAAIVPPVGDNITVAMQPPSCCLLSPAVACWRHNSVDTCRFADALLTLC